MNEIFSRNIPAISPEEQELLWDKRVLIAGCGGLGGYAVEYLTRLGIGNLTLADGDVFERTNLNRQLLSTQRDMGQSKADVAERRALSINPSAKINAVAHRLTEENIDSILSGIDLVIDAFDNVGSRFMMEEACSKAGIPLVHGAVWGWRAQIMTVTPGSGSLRSLYKNNAAASDKSTLSFVVGLCSAIQISEAVKLLCGRRGDLEDKVLALDMESLSYKIFEPSSRLFKPKKVKFTVKRSQTENDFEIDGNITIKEALDEFFKKESPMARDVIYVRRNGIYLSKEEVNTFKVQDGDVFTLLWGSRSGAGG